MSDFTYEVVDCSDLGMAVRWLRAATFPTHGFGTAADVVRELALHAMVMPESEQPQARCLIEETWRAIGEQGDPPATAIPDEGELVIPRRVFQLAPVKWVGLATSKRRVTVMDGDKVSATFSVLGAGPPELDEVLCAWAEERLDAMLRTTPMWGSNEAVEMQMLVTLEVLVLARKPGLKSLDWVMDRHTQFVRSRYGGRHLPLFEVETDQAKFVEALAAFRAFVMEELSKA